MHKIDSFELNDKDYICKGVAYFKGKHKEEIGLILNDTKLFILHGDKYVPLFKEWIAFKQKSHLDLICARCKNDVIKQNNANKDAVEPPIDIAFGMAGPPCVDMTIKNNNKVALSTCVALQRGILGTSCGRTSRLPCCLSSMCHTW